MGLMVNRKQAHRNKNKLKKDKPFSKYNFRYDHVEDVYIVLIIEN